MSIQMNSVSLENTEPLTMMKIKPKSEIIVENGTNILDSSESEDVKNIDIVYNPLCQVFIKSEILESKHCESLETQVLIKAENSPFIKTENITRRSKTEDTSYENVTKGIGQVVVEVQGSNEYSNVLSDLGTDTELDNSSKDLNGIGTKLGTKIRKAKHPKKTYFAKLYKTVETTSWKKDKEKIKVIKASVIPVEAHEYTSLAKDKHICNHCQQARNNLNNLKLHINKMHREVTSMYQCPYCPYKSKWSVQKHIIQKHKDAKDIKWFQCNLCKMKFKLKNHLTQHMNVHLKDKQIKDGLDLSEKSYHCNNCDYKTYRHPDLKRHNLVHLKSKEIQYFNCYHCSFKSKHKYYLKTHILRHFKKVEYKRGKRYDCNKCDYQTYTSTQLKRHKLNHLKPEDIPYFHCYHCSHKSKHKQELKKHIFRHFINEDVLLNCYICDFITQKRETIIEHIKKHSKIQIKFEINEGS